MKRKLLLFIALFIVCGAYSQLVDVTEQYITNHSFEECEVATTVEGVAQLIANDKSPVDYESNGWKLVGAFDGSSSYNAGVASYPVMVKYSKWLNGLEGPVNGPSESAGSKAMCFTGNKSAIYQSDEVTLPAGKYVLTVNVWAYNGGTSNPSPTIDVKGATGFLTSDGTEYFSKKKMFSSSAWDTDVIEIELTASTKGRFQLTYGASYFVTIDDLKLEYEDGVVTTSLVNLISKAQTLNEKLSNTDLSTAITAAQAFVDNPTTQDDVNIQLETLYGAMATALSATTEVVDITDVYVENASFETGSIDPWEWGDVIGAVNEPSNADSKPYIDGQNVVEFTSNGNNAFSQTATHLPAGFYAVDAKLNLKAYLVVGNSQTLCQGGSDALYLRVHPAVYEATEAGDVVLAAQSSSSFRIDNFRLFYGKDEASLLATLLQSVKDDAQAVMGQTQFANITGQELTNLLNAIEGTDANAINTALKTFVAAKDNYNRFVKAKENAASYNSTNYPYASQEIHEQIQNILNTAPSSSTQALSLTNELSEACTNLYYSNAYCDGVDKTDYTANVLGANASGTSINSAWTNSNSYMTVVTDMGSWTNPKTSETDKNVYGVVTSYYQASANKTSSLQQTVKNLPAGKYVVAITAKSPTDTPIIVKANSMEIGSLEGAGSYASSSWVEGVFGFEKATDANLILRIEFTPTANYKKWAFDNVRLYRLADGGDGIETVDVNNRENGVIYDLSGRRVAQPQKGLYIVNGKKLIRK